MEDIVRSINNVNNKEGQLQNSGTMDLDEYTINIEWLNNKKFIKQLEKDNIDVELLREELTRQNQIKRHYTWREKTLQLLKANFVQVVLSLLILIDAGIVITEIILEIHSMKSKNEHYAKDNEALRKLFEKVRTWFNYSSTDYSSTYNDTHSLINFMNASTKSGSLDPILFCMNLFESHIKTLNQTEDVIAIYQMSHNQKSSSHGDSGMKYSVLLHLVGLYLHYISIGVLAVFMTELILRVICIGERFFKKKVEMFDGTIIVTSFLADIVFVQVESEQISVMVIFLLWRIVRLINGLMMHEKQRDEFRITLQKKTRRLCQMKVDRLSTEKELLTKHVATLEELCKELGANEEQLKNCKPRFKKYSKEQTNNALKSIAALTTGFMGGMIGAPSSNQSAINRFSGTSPSPSIQSPTSSKKLKVMRKISETPYSSFDNSELELTPMTSHTLFLPSSESPMNSVDRESPFKFLNNKKSRQRGPKLHHSLLTDSEQDEKDQHTNMENERLLLASEQEEEANSELIIIRHPNKLNFNEEEHDKVTDRDSNTNAQSRGYASSVSHSTSTSEPNENEVDENRDLQRVTLTQAERCRTFREKFRSQEVITTQESSIESRPSVDEGVDFNPCTQYPVTTTTTK